MRKDIVDPVRVVDNGVRSFIPPTFCFELRDLGGVLVETVSKVTLPEYQDFAAVEFLQTNDLAALGHVTDCDSGEQARILGREFTITQVVQPE